MNANRFLPALETLETRDTPAGIVTGSLENGTWTLVGDADANDILINPTGVANQFAVTGRNGTSVAGLATASNVKNIVIKLGSGLDEVDVNNTGVLTRLRGNLRIVGGHDAKFIDIDKFRMRNLAIVSGANGNVDDELYLSDLIVDRNLTIHNGNGNSYVNIISYTSINSIGGNLTVINGVGSDDTYVEDTHIAGNVNIQNGLPDASGEAGNFEMRNSNNETSRSVIGGDVSLRYQSGNANDDIGDTEVMGDVNINYGSGHGQLYLDGREVAQPVHIHGNLTVLGQDDLYMVVGQETGLVVDGNLTIQTGSAADRIEATHLRVGGATQISTGGGNDTILIDDSSFAGPVRILTGGGADEVQIESKTGTSFGTLFARAFNVDLGGGKDALRLGIQADPTAVVELQARGQWHGGAGFDTLDWFHVDPVFGYPSIVSFEDQSG